MIQILPKQQKFSKCVELSDKFCLIVRLFDFNLRTYGNNKKKRQERNNRKNLGLLSSHISELVSPSCTASERPASMESSRRTADRCD